MKYKAGNIEACIPISTLLEYLEKKGFKIESGRVSDYHFNELYFLLSGNAADPGEIKIDKIEKHQDGRYYCTCHWSIVEMNNEAKQNDTQ